MKYFLILMVVYFVFFGDATFTIRNKKVEHEFKFNGLLWVLLDHWSINKYHSSDIPMKIFTYNKINNNA